MSHQLVAEALTNAPSRTGTHLGTDDRDCGAHVPPHYLGGTRDVTNSQLIDMATSTHAKVGAELAPLLLTVPEAARLLAIGRSAVYQLIWNGELTPVRIGRSVRFAVTELERFVAERAEDIR